MKTGPRAGVRIVAAGLILGGLLGVLGTSIALRNHKAEWPGAAAAVAMFLWTVWSGVAAWQGRPWGLRAARVLLLLQTIQFGVWRLSYEFSTLISLRLMAGNTTRRIGGNIGSSFDLNWVPQDAGFLLGVNVIAVGALACLMLSTRSPRTS